MEKTKRIPPAWLILMVISLSAGLLLGATNELTWGKIDAQAKAKAEAARRLVLSGAASFEQLELRDDTVDYCYEGTDASGAVAGHVCQVTVKGYGGDVEVTVGLDAGGVVTGISVGGASFAETPGLGAKVKETAFTGQFAGMATPLAVTKDGGEVDSVSGATRSSRAVADAVNIAAEYVAGLD